MKQLESLLGMKRVQCVKFGTRVDSKEKSGLVVVLVIHMGHFFWVSVDLSGSEFIFGVSQDPPICVHASLSQGGFYQRSLWVLVSLSITPLFTSKGSSYTYVVREVISLLE